jgi:hypothetical protein
MGTFQISGTGHAMLKALSSDQNKKEEKEK